MKRDKEKQRIRVKKYLNKNPWMKSLIYIRARCNNPNKQWYELYGGRGIKCAITGKELKELWFRDKAYEMKKPSIDRINTNGNYSLENCQYLELKINSGKEGYKQRISIQQFDLQGNFIKEYDGIITASKETKINYSNIRSNIQGKQQTAGGYIWKYKDIIK